MTPAARTQAAIDLVDRIAVAAREGGAAADTILQHWFAERRYAGSKDRRAIRELVFRAIRCAGEPPTTGRAALVALADEDEALARTFDGSGYGPAAIDPDEPRAPAGIAPAWLADALSASGVEDPTALVGRAPLDIRVNRLRAELADIAVVFPDARPIAGIPDALRLPPGTNVAPFAGRVEVQDAGSQIVTGAVPAAPGSLVVDLCAGAGGKTLALAAALENRGRIIATDTDRARLARLTPRAAQAGVTIAETRLLNPGREAAALADLAGQADAVLVDAPCSGTGTWRRNPEARWRLTPARLDRYAATQAHLLDVAVPLVRPGGAFVYVVCSLLDAEGAAQIDSFLARHPAWRADPLHLAAGSPRGQGVRLSPAAHGTDGFFVARLLAP